MGLIFLLPVALLIGIGLIVLGLFGFVRARLPLAEVEIRGFAARLLGLSLIVIGLVCFAAPVSYFNARWPLLHFWRPLAAVGFSGATASLIWAGWQHRQWALVLYGLFLLILGTLISTPPTSLAAIVFRLTGDRRFKAPNYGW